MSRWAVRLEILQAFTSPDRTPRVACGSSRLLALLGPLVVIIGWLWLGGFFDPEPRTSASRQPPREIRDALSGDPEVIVLGWVLPAPEPGRAAGIGFSACRGYTRRRCRRGTLHDRGMA